MKTIELFNSTSTTEFERYASELAAAYKIAFAGEPWNERSRCDAQACEKGFCELAAGSSCPACSSQLVEAYDENELIENWMNMLASESAFMEVSMQDGIPYLATIARPTSAQELYERKYSDVPAMKQWIKKTMPNGEFVWIEDTFANRDMQPRSNLANRGETLGRIALQYDGLQIATRTLSPAVIAATIRDVGAATSLYEGEKKIAMRADFRTEPIDVVPDSRSFLKVDGEKLL